MMTYKEWKLALKARGFKFIQFGSAMAIFRRMDDHLVFAPLEQNCGLIEDDAVEATAAYYDTVQAERLKCQAKPA